MSHGEGGPNLPVGNTEVADRNFDRGKEDQAAWYAHQEQQKAAILLKQKQIAEARQREEFKAATWKRQYNPLDGLVHTDDGRKWNLDGQEVVEEVQLTDHFDDGADAKTRSQDAMADGLIHNADGTLTDPVTNEPVESP